jgi:hypothetical protein
LFLQLMEKPDSATRYRCPMILDLLEEHSAVSDRRERGRLDDILYEKLSDYLVLQEMLWAVRMHRPKNTIREISDCRRTENRLAWNIPTSCLIAESDNLAVQRALEVCMEMSTPSGGKNRKWLQDFNDAHKASQTLWQATASHHERRLKNNNLSSAEVRTCMLVLQAWKSEEYRKALDIKKQQIQASLVRTTPATAEDTFLPLPKTETANEPKVDVHQSKAKVKTRGEGHPTEEAAINEPVPEASPAISRIAVPKKAYATFRYMFPQTEEERQKDVTWDTFVSNMTDAGFIARNGGGSIVTFEDVNGTGRINFHKPHPEPVIDPVMLRTMGRRLNKWFGWDRERFVLAGR